MKKLRLRGLRLLPKDIKIIKCLIGEPTLSSFQHRASHTFEPPQPNTTGLFVGLCQVRPCGPLAPACVQSMGFQVWVSQGPTTNQDSQKEPPPQKERRYFKDLVYARGSG